MDKDLNENNTKMYVPHIPLFLHQLQACICVLHGLTNVFSTQCSVLNILGANIAQMRKL